MGKKRDIDASERALFRDAAGTVRPLKQDRVAPHRAPPHPEPMQTRADAAEVVAELLTHPYDPADVLTGDELHYLRPGVQHSTLRKLRRGHYAIEAELDLHGLIVSAARAAVARFLAASHARGLRCVKIIHGKGLGSARQQPVLKGKTDVWLRRRDDVLAFCSARSVDGGTGAVYVLLKKANY